MLNEEIRPSSLLGIKRLAKQIKKSERTTHSQALRLAAKAASFENYEHARRILSDDHGFGIHKHQLFLTIYWHSTKPYAVGRETIEVWLSKPILEICSKPQMKLVRGLAGMRLVAPDHLVADDLAQSQDYARGQLCKVIRALRFMEATALKPCDYRAARLAKKKLDKDLPQKDHTSDWYDPSTGQYILIDEPYGNAIVNRERADWAARNDWHLAASSWPGIYYPYSCGFFVATDATNRYDFDALMRKINALDKPIVSENWNGISVESLETFTSPLARTAQDKRRARAKGTVFRLPSKNTVPYSWRSEKRRPKATMPVAEHQEAGRMIKSVLQSRHKPWAVNRRLDSLRCTLEDWLNMELQPDQLQGPEFFDVYYHHVEDDEPYVAIASSEIGVIEILIGLKLKLQKFYPDCAPLRSMIHKIETSLRIIERMKLKSEKIR